MISINKLRFSYYNNRLIDNLNLAMQVGHTYGLFGLNGAGKSTLLHLICGLLFPDKGSCTIETQESSKRNPEILQTLYLLPERFDLPNIKISSYVDLYESFYPKFDRAYFHDLLNTLQVPLDRKTGEISFGQRKKFLISFALATQCKLLLLDEPTNGLDIPSKSQFRKIIAAADNTNRCIVVSTHQVRDLETMIDHMTVLHNGDIIFQQSIAEINQNLQTCTFADRKSSTELLYHEDTMGGQNAIVAREAGDDESKVDLELLFNGIIQNTDEINRPFNKK